ncbi:hypothetical protein Fmac_031962 [Flemingia macrophylla]|uniref:Uncharacterized protein n=1 Tax=Flemingia macrophylla TaxID=520843 RepID=A0ABD1L3K1_9FABA
MVVMREQLRNGRGFNHSVNHADPHNLIISLILLLFSLNLPFEHRSLLLSTSGFSNKSNNGLLNYQCLFPQSSTLSLFLLLLLLLLHFYILITTAQPHLSFVTPKLASHLSLSPFRDTSSPIPMLKLLDLETEINLLLDCVLLFMI